MKKLFKNSFFSFFKNKLAISLLMIIVFLTTATFTMFNSATHAFKASYDQVMTEGNRHEYTIKEMYNIDGDAVFTNPVAETGADSTYKKDVYVVGAPSDANYKYNGKDYVVFPIAISAMDMMGSTTTSKGIALIDPVSASLGRLKIIIPSTIDVFGTPSLYANKAALMADTSANFSKEIDLTFGTKNVVIANLSYADIKADVTSDIASLITTVKSELVKGFTLSQVDYQKYYFGIDANKSGKIYQDLNAVNNYKYEFGIPASISNPDWTNQQIYPLNAGLDESKVAIWQTILKSTLYESAKYKMHEDMLAHLSSYKNQNQEAELIYKDVESVQVSSNSEIFKFVRENKSEVDKIKIFEGSLLPKSMEVSDLNKKLVDDAQKNFFDSLSSNNPAAVSYWQSIMTMASDPKQIANTGWTAFVTRADATFRVIDPSSFAAVVSPTYAANKGITAMSKTTYDNIMANQDFLSVIGDATKSFLDVKDVLNKIVPSNEQNSILYAGNTPFFVVGTGITPDFAFPIISAENPLPNTSNQAIIYANNAGYARIEQANKGSQKENYIAYTFANGVNAARRAEIQADVAAYANKVTSWPTGINAVEKYDSDSENVLMTPTRVTFLEKLNHTISSVSWIVTSLLVLFTAFIVALVIKKQIDNRKKQLGILMANGYSKLEIASSMMVIGLIVAVVPALAGYLVGHFMQFALMNIFSNYWTLPIWNTQFSWIALVVTVVAPLAGMSLLAFIISLYTLRGRIPDILAGETTKSGFVTKQIMRPVKYFGIKTKMGMSLVFSNVGKLSIAFIAFAASIIALSVSMNSVGKFDYAQQQSEAATDYEYQVDLVTPTKEAGLYSSQTIDNIYYSAYAGKKIDYAEYSKDYTKLIPTMESPSGALNGGGADIDHHDDAIMLHAASGIDGTFAMASGKYFPYYLKNRIQIKELLNSEIASGSNPWQIASQLMPENQKNTADIKSAEFIDFTAKNYKIDQPGKFDNLLNTLHVIENKDGKFVVSTDLSKLAKGFAFIDEYKDFIAYGLAKATKQYIEGDHSTPLPYFMSYNNVLIDKGDELYTHIDIDLTRENVNKEIKVNPIKIRGIGDDALKNHTSKINLSDASLNALEKNKPNGTNSPVPVVINKYMAEYYRFKNGDVFSAPISNMVDRYQVDVKPTKEFKIVGIENTYNDGKVYTLQNYANDVLGLTDPSMPSNPLAKVPFNGVMTSEEKPMIFNSMSLYSQSGVYPGKNFISATIQDESYKSIDKAFFDPSIAATDGGQLKFPNPKIDSMAKLIKTYGSDTTIVPMGAVYSTVDWSKVSDYQFTSIMDLSSALMNTVQVIVMFIALAFVLLISTMIIADNTKFIATLKVMGYRTKEISRIFLATFVPSLLLALAVSIPLVFGLEEAIRVGIMGFGHVLIPLYIAGWEVAAAFGILVIGFLAMYFISLRGLKNTSLLQAFQE